MTNATRMLLMAAAEMRTLTWLPSPSAQAIFYHCPAWHSDLLYNVAGVSVARENGAQVAESLAYDNTDGPS